MFGQIFISDRLESSGADVQSQISQAYPFLLEFRKKFLVEMKPGRRCRHGARLPGENGLVSFLVISIGRSVNIRGKRQMSMIIQNRKNVGWKTKDIEFPFSSLDGDFQFIINKNRAVIFG